MTTQCIILFFKKVTQNRQNSLPGETYPYVTESVKYMPPNHSEQLGLTALAVLVTCSSVTSVLLPAGTVLYVYVVGTRAVGAVPEGTSYSATVFSQK